MNAQTSTMERPALAELPPPAPRGNVVTIPPQPAPKAYPPKMARAILAVTREIGAVEKNGWNDFHKYKYQKWDDILDRLSVLLPQHGLIITPSEVARSLFENEQLMSITYEFIIVNEDGDVWPERPRLTAIARARDGKGTPDDKAAAKAHTQAEKYFLIHFFKIRTGDMPDSDGDGATVRQTAAPAKPPRPGSAEAKALDEPRLIDPQGHNQNTWVEAFIAATENATPDEMQIWCAENKAVLAKIGNGQYPDAHAKIEKHIAARSGDARQQAAPTPPKPPRPPKPEQAEAPAAKPMPDPEKEPAAWVAWLTDKLAGFQTYEAGESYWNDTIQALDLSFDVQEEAMGCWRRFEERFAP